jgi:hypothetical protein
MNWLVALQNRARLRQPESPINTTVLIESNTINSNHTIININNNTTFIDDFDSVDLLESGRRRLRRAVTLRTSNRMLFLFVLLMSLLLVAGATAWWLHSPSSASLGSSAAWWQRFFAEHSIVVVANSVAMATLSDSFAPSPSAPAAAPTLPANMCENTKQGRLLVTDEHGYVCATTDLDLTRPGCCLPPVQTGFERFSCETCDPHLGCCQTYEFCVSCCLGSENRAQWTRCDAWRATRAPSCASVPPCAAHRRSASRPAPVQGTQQTLFRNCATQ